ncbi:hypothetical protein Tco_0283050 [Tanacetum coccineum]
MLSVLPMHHHLIPIHQPSVLKHPALTIHHAVTIRQLDVPIPQPIVSIPEVVMLHPSKMRLIRIGIEDPNTSRYKLLRLLLKGQHGKKPVENNSQADDGTIRQQRKRLSSKTNKKSSFTRLLNHKRIPKGGLGTIIVDQELLLYLITYDGGVLVDIIDDDHDMTTEMVSYGVLCLNILEWSKKWFLQQDWRKVGIVSSEESRIMYHGLQAVSIGRLKVLIEYLEAVIGTQASVYPLAVGHTIDSLSIFPSAYYVQWRSYEEIGEGYGPPTTLSHSVNAYPPILRNFDMSEREKETPGSQVKGVFDDLSAEHLPLVSSHEHVISSKEREPSDKVPVEPVSVLVEKSSAKPVPPPVSRHLGAPLAEGSRPTASAGTTTTLVVSMN